MVDPNWHAFCQALKKDIEVEDWRWLYDAYKEMSWAVGVKKPQEPRMQEKNTTIQCVKTTSR